MKRIVQVFSNGSLHFSNINFIFNSTNFEIYEKDHTNFHFNKKKKKANAKNLRKISKYKNKYLF